MSNPNGCICADVTPLQPLQNDILMKDIEECIQYFKKTRDLKYPVPYQNTIREGRYQLLNIISKIKSQDARRSSKQSKEDLERSQFLAAMNIDLEKNKILHLRKEWAQQQNALGKVQDALFRKCRLLSLNSNYCSTQGNYLCSPLAFLMEKKQIVEFFLSNPELYLIGFVNIANGCLCSYGRTYAVEAPLEDSTETGFILALFTCLAQISALPGGVELFAERAECHNLICEILSSLPKMKYCTTEQIKFLLLKILHNVVKNKECKNFFWNCAELFPAINKLMQQEYCEPHHKLLLEILMLVSKDIPCEDCLEKIKKELDFDTLKQFEERKAVSEIPQRILRNIDISDRYFETLKLQIKLANSVKLPDFSTFKTWSDDSFSDIGIQCKQIASCTKCICQKIKEKNLQRAQSAPGVCNCYDNIQLPQNNNNAHRAQTQTSESKPNVQVLINVDAQGQATCTKLDNTSVVPYSNEDNQIALFDDMQDNSRENLHKPFQITNRFVIKSTQQRQKYVTRIKIRGLTLEQAPDTN